MEKDLDLWLSYRGPWFTIMERIRKFMNCHGCDKNKKTTFSSDFYEARKLFLECLFPSEKFFNTNWFYLETPSKLFTHDISRKYTNKNTRHPLRCSNHSKTISEFRSRIHWMYQAFKSFNSDLILINAPYAKNKVFYQHFNIS